VRIKSYAVLALAVALAGCSAAAEPTPTMPEPTPRIVEVEVPGPTQTIEVEVVREVRVEVDRVPQACVDAYGDLFDHYIAALEWQLDVLGDYVDYPDEDLIDFGRRFEARVATMPDVATLDHVACSR
jgi:hypothetical protein